MVRPEETCIWEEIFFPDTKEVGDIVEDLEMFGKYHTELSNKVQSPVAALYEDDFSITLLEIFLLKFV